MVAGSLILLILCEDSSFTLYIEDSSSTLWIRPLCSLLWFYPLHYNFTPVKMCLSEMGIAAGNVSLKALVYSYGHRVRWPSKGWRTSSVLFVLKKVRYVGIRLSSVFKRLEQ